LEILMLLLTICYTGLMACSLITALSRGVRDIPFELSWMLESTPALYNYVLFVINAFTCLLIVSLLCRSSNHIVMSLEILYLFSIMIPVLFHFIKDTKISE